MPERPQPLWLKIILNMCGPIGVGLALLGYLNAGLGLFFLGASALYIGWGIYPHSREFTKRSKWLSLIMFVMIGSLLGMCSWLLLRRSLRVETAKNDIDVPKPVIEAPFAFTEPIPDVVTVVIDNGAGFHIETSLRTVDIQKTPFTGLLDIGGLRPLAVYIQNGTFFVDASITDGTGHEAVQIKRNKLEVKPAEWDRNFSPNAVEVVDRNQRPIFQMIRKSGDSDEGDRCSELIVIAIPGSM
jgi:hypothetical protein